MDCPKYGFEQSVTNTECDDSRAENLEPWDKFLLACRAEWDLVVEKTESLIQTIDKNRDVIGLNELD